MLPDSVLGGMTTFLFASVVVSGIRILAFLPWTRRERFIVAASLSLGLGTALVPGVLTHMIDYKGDSAFLSSLITSVNIILDTGFALGAIVSCLLNAMLPVHPVAKSEQADVIDRHGPMAAMDADRLAAEEDGHGHGHGHDDIEDMKIVEAQSAIHNGSIHSTKN